MLIAVSAGLAITLGVVLASGHDHRSSGRYGMMQSADWSRMQSCMRDVMGEDTYERMLYQCGQMGVDGWTTQQMLNDMWRVTDPSAFDAMIQQMRQLWGDDWQEAMPMMRGMMGCWN